MTSDRLDNLANSGDLNREPPTRVELDGLIQSGAARIKDAENESLSIESRFDLAYNAAHAFALAALRYHGYRPSHKRYLVFQLLQDTLKLSPQEWRVLDQAHRKRNLTEYEGNVDIDVKLVDGVIRIVRELEKRFAALPPIDG